MLCSLWASQKRPNVTSLRGTTAKGPLLLCFLHTQCTANPGPIDSSWDIFPCHTFAPLAYRTVSALNLWTTHAPSFHVPPLCISQPIHKSDSLVITNRTGAAGWWSHSSDVSWRQRVKPSGEKSTTSRSTVSTVNSASDSHVVVSYSLTWSLPERERERQTERGACRGHGSEKVRRQAVLVVLTVPW